jgi:isopenicillin N synthase-like dioxygenase
LAGAPGAFDRAAEELRFALTEIGFYFIVNHGVPSGQIREVFRQAARFHAQPLETKLDIKLDKHNVGYLPMKGDTLRTSTVETVTKANLNEALFVTLELLHDHPLVLADRRFRSANQWPADLPGFRDIVVDYCDTMERLVQKLVRLYARALSGQLHREIGGYPGQNHRMPMCCAVDEIRNERGGCDPTGASKEAGRFAHDPLQASPLLMGTIMPNGPRC